MLEKKTITKKNKATENNVFGIIVERRSSTIESCRSSCFRQKVDNRTSRYCNIFENVVSLCENKNALTHFRCFTPLILKRQSWELVLASFEQVMKILTLTQKKLKSVFWGNIPFSYPFHRGIGQKKPHDKTTEKVKILLLTITILNKGNYRIIKRGLKNFAKKENFGTDKQSNKIQAKIQDKLYLQDLFGNSGYNDWFEWTKEKTFILNWTRTIELMNLRNLTMTIT